RCWQGRARGEGGARGSRRGGSFGIRQLICASPDWTAGDSVSSRLDRPVETFGSGRDPSDSGCAENPPEGGLQGDLRIKALSRQIWRTAPLAALVASMA